MTQYSKVCFHQLTLGAALPALTYQPTSDPFKGSVKGKENRLLSAGTSIAALSTADSLFIWTMSIW
jgi:hypothetical protein